MTGEAVPILLDLVDRGIIRVLDALFVRKDEDGTFSGVDLADLDEDTAGDLTAFAGASTGLIHDDDAALAAAEIEPGSAAVILVYENRWAAPCVNVVRPGAGTGRTCSATRDTIQQFKDLADLKAQSILIDEEFAAEKAKILAA
jgi:hypothetical protein